MAKKTSAPRNEAAAQARAQAQAQVRAQERRTRAVIIAASAVVVVLFVGLIMFIIDQANVAEKVPAAADSSYGFPVGTTGLIGQDMPTDAVRVDVYADYRCSFCARFEIEVGGELDAMREEGLIELYYHPIAILDGGTGGNSSLTAAAVVAVVDGAPELYLDYNRELFERQPTTSNWTAQQLADQASSLGAPPEVLEDIRTAAFREWVREATQQASRDGVGGTPTIMIDGRIVRPDEVDYFNPVQLRAFIEALAAQ